MIRFHCTPPSAHPAGPLHLHWNCPLLVPSSKTVWNFCSSGPFFLHLQRRVKRQQWNHGCLTCPSLANSCILLRLQLQKRERSCRFYVQVFATDFPFFCPPPTASATSHCVFGSSIVVAIPPVTRSSLGIVKRKGTDTSFKAKVLLSLKKCFFIIFFLFFATCFLSLEKSRYFHQRLTLTLSPPPEPLPYLHAGNLVCMRPRRCFANGFINFWTSLLFPSIHALLFFPSSFASWCPTPR